MILIDAININSGGGINVLSAVINSLYKNNVEFIVLCNEKAELPLLKESNSFLVQNTSVFNRRRIIRRAVQKYKPKSILTYNFPLPFNPGSSVKTVTDFQNLHLVKGYDSSVFSLRQRFSFYLKRLYLKYYLRNTQLYITPTSFVNEKFKKTYGQDVPCQLMSYFDKETLDFIKSSFVKKRVTKKADSFIYVSSPSLHKNHLNLLAAWKVLNEQRINPVLKLTLPLSDIRSSSLIKKINTINRNGGNIINISEGGFMAYEEVLKHTYSSSFTIYPTLNETFGFGLVEGALMGNSILASDRDFTYDVVSPSLSFEPTDVNDIVLKVKQALEVQLPETKLLFKDQSEALAELLVNNSKEE